MDKSKDQVNSQAFHYQTELRAGYWNAVGDSFVFPQTSCCRLFIALCYLLGLESWCSCLYWNMQNDWECVAHLQGVVDHLIPTFWKLLPSLEISVVKPAEDQGHCKLWQGIDLCWLQGQCWSVVTFYTMSQIQRLSVRICEAEVPDGASKQVAIHMQMAIE